MLSFEGFLKREQKLIDNIKNHDPNLEFGIEFFDKYDKIPKQEIYDMWVSWYGYVNNEWYPNMDKNILAFSWVVRQIKRMQH